MSETRIEIPDEPSDGNEAAPYRNLWVPLIVVPAAIVIAIVAVFALFGSISGREATPAENLSRVINGGKNQRDQALFNLTRQALENHEARIEGSPLPWATDPEFIENVRAAVDEIDADELDARLTLGILLGTLGDDGGVPILVSILDTADGDDADGHVRFDAIHNLGLLKDERATAAVLRYLQHEDEGLRTVAASALANLPGERVRAGLVAALSDTSLTVRGSAALALTHLDPPAGEAAEVLRELIEKETYTLENERDSTRFKNGQLVSENRVKAVRALARLGRPEDRPLFEALKGDPDIALQEAGMLGLADLDGQ